MSARRVTGCMLVAMLAGCGGGSPVPGPSSSPSASPDPPPTPTTASFPPCSRYFTGKGRDPIPGMIVPEAPYEITEIKKQGPIVTVEGYVRLEPIRFRKLYERRRDIKVLQSEDEIFEAELLITDGRFRNFWKARIICKGGSQFVAIVAREVKSSAVPTPTGSPSG